MRGAREAGGGPGWRRGGWRARGRSRSRRPRGRAGSRGSTWRPGEIGATRAARSGRAPEGRRAAHCLKLAAQVPLPGGGAGGRARAPPSAAGREGRGGTGRGGAGWEERGRSRPGRQEPRGGLVRAVGGASAGFARAGLSFCLKTSARPKASKIFLFFSTSFMKALSLGLRFILS